MKPDILILRPELGSRQTAERAEAMGLKAVTAPIFHIRPIAWQPPNPALFDAMLLTSANAARHAGPGLAAFMHLPCYAVGETTAAAAIEAGFVNVLTGKGDASDIVGMMRESGIQRVFHPCGQDHIPLDCAKMTIERRIVYSADAIEMLPDVALTAIRAGALVLLHSPRAAAHFAKLANAAGVDRSATRLAAISEAAASKAGDGWKMVAISPHPRDQALVELAARLCKSSAER